MEIQKKTACNQFRLGNKATLLTLIAADCRPHCLRGWQNAAPYYVCVISACAPPQTHACLMKCLLSDDFSLNELHHAYDCMRDTLLVSCCSWRPAAVLLSASTIFFIAVSFTAEPLLACVVAGLITTNRR